MLTPESALRKDKSNAGAPVMQHRHFAVIAGIIATTIWSPVHEDDTQERVAQAFARKLAATNPNFNRARFLRACGVAS